ncbi:MAG: DUF302 domain-containing protein [Tissierellia bacterium]|nr:DUF302 domain-containing protein [Tissierellia bacterium]
MEIIYEKRVNLTLSEALESLKAELKERKFGVLYELNFRDKLVENDLAFDHDFYVLEVCNPGFAKQVLDQHLDMGYFMPCKMAVYEDAEGVKLGMLKPSQLMSISGYTDLEQMASNVDDILSEAIDAVVKRADG